MSILIKICGISEISDIDIAVASGVNMIGLVFFEKSPRHLEIDKAVFLSSVAGEHIKKVLVTVDANDDLFSKLIKIIGPDIIQLHGSETPERIKSIREKFSLPIIKSIGIKGKQDISQIVEFEPVADYLLLEAKAESSAGRPGGNGAALDWGLLKEIRPKKPWFIAGGLNSSNVGIALNLTGADGVDVSSGVERSPGVKDGVKIEDFVREVRKAETSLVLAPSPMDSA